MIGVGDLPCRACGARGLCSEWLNLAIWAGGAGRSVGGGAVRAGGARDAVSSCLVIARVAGCREGVGSKENEKSECGEDVFHKAACNS